MSRDDMAEEPKHRLHWGFKLLIGLAALILAAAGGLYALGIVETNRWERYAEKLRATGVPLTLAEVLEHQGSVPVGATGATLMTELAERLSEVSVEDEDSRIWQFDRQLRPLDVFAGIPADSIEPTRAFLASHRELLDELGALADMPAGRITIPRDATFDDVMGLQIAYLRVAGRLLHNQGVMSLLDKDLASAIRSVRLQCRASEMLDGHPTVIMRLVEVAGNEMMLATIEALVSSTTLDGTTIKQLEQDVRSRLDAASLKPGLIGDRALFLAYIDQLLDGMPFPGDLESALDDVPRWAARWWVRHSQIRGVEIYTELIDAYGDLDAYTAAGARFANELEEDTSLAFVGVFMPSTGRAGLFDALDIARLRCALVALAAERFRMANDRFPTSLTELVPTYLDEIPLDPMDKQPLRLATGDEGIVIYSLGENGEDDGGDVAQSAGHIRYVDVGFRLASPEYRGVVILDEPPPEGD